jgi:hypothetical protein
MILAGEPDEIHGSAGRLQGSLHTLRLRDGNDRVVGAMNEKDRRLDGWRSADRRFFGKTVEPIRSRQK